MKLVYRLTWLFSRASFALGHRWRVLNPERVPLTGPVILAANHASYLDPPLVGSGVRRPINYLARESLFRFPVFGWYLRQLNVVPVDRDGGGASGLQLAVIKSDAPVVPVRVFGTFEAWNRHMKLPRPRRVMVKYGVPMDFKALREEAKTCSKVRLKAIYQEIADQLMAAIAKLEPVEDALPK